MTQTVTTGPPGDEPRFPVFVDESGRRRRWLRVVGWVLGSLAAAYVALFAISVVSSPSLLPLTLPGVGRFLPNAGAPDIKVPGHGHQHPAAVVATASPAPSAGSLGVVPTPTLTARPSTRSTPAATTPPSAKAHPTAKPTAVPSATPTAHASPRAHPTSKATGKPTAQPTSTRGRSPTARPRTGPR
jgi:hypothetical protein